MSHDQRSIRRPSRRTLLGALGAAPLAAGSALAAPGIAHAETAASSRPRRVPKELRPGGAYDRLVAGLAADDAFSGNVLLAYRGRPVLARSYGMADKDRSVPNGSDTVFNTASLGKFFTGVSIMQLVAQRKLRLDATLGTFLDGFADPVANTVTVHHLLTNTSGLGDHRADPAWREASRGWGTPAEWDTGTMEFIQRQQLRFPPGTSFSYSNSGFWVLGAIVTKASGQSFRDYVSEHIWAPSGMARTSYATYPQWQTDRTIAHAYGNPDSAGRRTDLTAQLKGIGIGGGDGGAFSTAPDVLRFALAMQQGKLLSHAHTEMMVSGKYPVGPGMTAYATIAAVVNDERRFGHGGSDPGITCNLFVYPDLEWVSLFVSNYSLTDLRDLLELPERYITAPQG